MARKHEGKEYSVIMGRLKGETTLSDQAFRYPKDRWPVAEARRHCESHKGILFEPASGKDSKLAIVYNRPWAICPEFFGEMTEAQSGILGEIPLSFDEKLFFIVDGSAIVPIRGIIEQRPSIMSLIFGGAPVDILSAILKELAQNSDVKQIILEIDSPGGGVDGVNSLSDTIFAIRQQKPVVAFVHSLAASAAYWIASAASKVVLSSNTDRVGSIGVVSIHKDFSQAEKDAGVNVTEIFSGRFKIATSPHSPLDDTGKAVLQSQVDYLYSIFVEAVARNRGVDEKTVLANMAEGRVFIGQQAIDSGLADNIGSLEEIVESGNTITVKGVDNVEIKIENITTEFLAEHRPEIVAAQKAAQEKSFKDGLEAGIKQERARIGAIDAVAIPGFEGIISSAKADGITAEQAALKILQAQKSRGVSLQALTGESQNVDSAPISALTEEDEAKAEEAKAVDTMAAAGNARRKKA